MDLLDLPRDIFMLVVAHLCPKDLLILRHVSAKFNAAFIDSELNYIFLLQHFPRCMEVRSYNSSTSDVDYAALFHRVVRRYHQLSHGVPATIRKHTIAQSFVLPAWSRSYPISVWQRQLRFENKQAPFDYPDTLWTYDQGLLIFPSAELSSYAVLELGSRTLSALDIEADTRTTRRLRLKDNVLVIEWCEPEPFHRLNESELVYRHFATAYDIAWSKSTGRWQATFRNEWKVHFLGMPLNSQDRFFSVHNGTHYALYIWQPNRSAWGEDEPLESLTIFDISKPSAYRLSQDPTGRDKILQGTTGVKAIKRLSLADLDFYRIRQRTTPELRYLRLDEQHVYFIQENHRWMEGNQASLVLPRLHEVKSTGIPFHNGPYWESTCDLAGDSDMSFCQKSSNARGPHLAPCWRHEEYPYLTVDEVIDTEAGVTFSARQCFMLEAIQISLQPTQDAEAHDLNLQDDLWQELLVKGRICGEERWLIGENSRKEVVVMYFDP